MLQLKWLLYVFDGTWPEVCGREIGVEMWNSQEPGIKYPARFTGYSRAAAALTGPDHCAVNSSVIYTTPFPQAPFKLRNAFLAIIVFLTNIFQFRSGGLQSIKCHLNALFPEISMEETINIKNKACSYIPAHTCTTHTYIVYWIHELAALHSGFFSKGFGTCTPELPPRDIQ